MWDQKTQVQQEPVDWQELKTKEHILSIKTDIGFLLIVILPKMIIVKLVDSFSRAFRGTGAFALVSAQHKQSFITIQQE